ncbi:restriction endonuclease subunit S [Spirulina major]|uniref:restriction endonuclease subunit S n=1 Tax=Spirulina major TaxID=270636 RepID=UPI000ADFE305|nr:restriction endonuclease subunit S [Spirulina major]
MKWEVKKIKDLGIIQTGATPKTSDAKNFGNYISFVKPADFLPNGEIKNSGQKLSKTGLQKTRLIKANSVLMVCIGATIGKAGFSALDITTNQQINSLTPERNYDAKFIYYQMLTQEFQKRVKHNASQATLPIINKTKWGNLTIRIPPIAEQKRIVEILDECFAGIERAEAIARQNLTNARELFDSYLNKLFQNPPEDWSEKSLGEVCRFQGGSQPPKSEFVSSLREGYIRLIQIRDYKTDEKKVFIPLEKAKRFCEKDDIMIGRYGPPLFQILRGLEGAYNVALMKAIPNEKIISRDYLFYFLKNRSILH